jgi:hypothetical protein
MAYERDTDRHLRGVGAIASRDAIDPRRSAIRSARARATNARDRQLSQITYQARGGMGRFAMGAINQPLVGGGGASWSGPPTGNLTKVYSGSGGMGILGPVQSPPPPPQYAEPTVPPPIALMTPPIMMPPTPAPAKTPTVIVSPSDIGVMVGAAPPPVPLMPTVVIPTLPPAGASTTASSSSTWLLVGAVGLAAYLLFFAEPSET